MWKQRTVALVIACGLIGVIWQGILEYQRQAAVRRLQGNQNFHLLNAFEVVEHFNVRDVFEIAIFDEQVDSGDIDDISKMFLVEQLSFRRCTFPQPSTKKISQLQQVERFIFRECTADSNSLICALSNVPRIRTLSMVSMDIKNTACWRRLPNSLRILNFWKSHLSKGVLIDVGNLQGLTSLSMKNATFDSSELFALAHCGNLEYVNISNTTVDDNDVSKLKICSKLREINLSKTRVSPNILPILKEFKSLEKIYLSESLVSSDDCLRILGPNVTVHFTNSSDE